MWHVGFWNDWPHFCTGLHARALHRIALSSGVEEIIAMAGEDRCWRMFTFKVISACFLNSASNYYALSSLKGLTLGILSFVQAPSDSSLSRISHAKIDGHSLLYWAILPTTSGVATRGLLPPIALGLMEPVS